MEHAKTFIEFIPSLNEAKLFEKEWKETQNYQNYKLLCDIFLKKEATSFTEKCLSIGAIYGGIGSQSFKTIIETYSNIPQLHERIMQGDHSVVDELQDVGGSNLCILSRMFCHHNNPGAYFGFSKKIFLVMQALVKKEKLTWLKIDKSCYEKYEIFDRAMKNIIVRYELTSLTNTQIDILFESAYDMYANEIDVILKESKQ